MKSIGVFPTIFLAAVAPSTVLAELFRQKDSFDPSAPTVGSSFLLIQGDHDSTHLSNSRVSDQRVKLSLNDIIAGEIEEEETILYASFIGRGLPFVLRRTDEDTSTL